jgi:hypothetical protein
MFDILNNKAVEIAETSVSSYRSSFNRLQLFQPCLVQFRDIGFEAIVDVGNVRFGPSVCCLGYHQRRGRNHRRHQQEREGQT